LILIGSRYQLRALFFKGSDDSQEFFIVDVIVALGWNHAL
jgi:hypothetical protein